jgi:D-glycero-alpha-D-manno-heptose-7-phosphate kinase
MKIISQAPCRISLFGGGTDVAPFCNDYGGLVINLAINLRNVVAIDTHVFEEMTVNPLLKAILEKYELTDSLGFGLSILSREEGAGVGSSGSFAVAILGAIRTHLNLPFTRHQIAQEAFEMEVKQLHWHGGCQDQFAAAYGGFNLMAINDEVKVVPFPRDQADDLLPWLVLLDTGIRRRSYQIQEGFKKPTHQQTQALMTLKGLVPAARAALRHRRYPHLGELLVRTWEEKKKSNPGVSTASLDALFTKAKKLGALGGKICGAGGGGYSWFLCPPEKRKSFIKGMALRQVDFGVDWTGLEVRKE